MRTEIKIVMPATEDEDAASDNEYTLGRSGVQPGAAENSSNHVESLLCAPSRPERSKSAHSGKRHLRTRHRTRVRKGSGPGFEKPAEVSFHTAHQQYLNENLEQTYNVVLDKQLPETDRKNVKESTTKPQEFRVSITAGYDIDLEHHDIMLKALKAYSRHRNSDPAEEEETPNSNKVSPTHKKSGPGETQRPAFKTEMVSRLISSNGILPNFAKGFKLSQCRLRFYDDDDPQTMRSVSSGKGPSHSVKHKAQLPSPGPKVTAIPMLFQLEESDDLLVDAVGHVYKTNRIRPWTALPVKSADNIKLNNDTFLQDTFRSSVAQPPDSPRLVTTYQSNRRLSVPSSSHSVLFADGKMTDITQSNNFLRRNKTTHLWTDGSQLMSRSLPTSSFIHQRMGGSASSSPRSSRDANSEKTSPAAGKLAPGRPSSSYSYDGGFFLGAHAGHAEYFVIHPDWVSEAVTIKKLSIGNKTSGAPVSKSASFKSGVWSGRRCLSAPPAKRRNPITWETPDTLDVPDKQY